jgi:hypothetical protein
MAFYLGRSWQYPAFAFVPVWTSPYLPLSPASEAANPASWIWRPSFERHRDFNPPEQRAAQRARPACRPLARNPAVVSPNAVWGPRPAPPRSRRSGLSAIRGTYYLLFGVDSTNETFGLPASLLNTREGRQRASPEAGVSCRLQDRDGIATMRSSSAEAAHANDYPGHSRATQKRESLRPAEEQR